jgi:hypothetical protein
MKIIALILNILAIPATFFAGVAVMMSAMMFDAPGSENNKFLKVAFYSLLSLPVVLVVTDIFGWIKFVKGDYSGAVFAYKWVLLVVIIFVVSLLMTGR